MKAVGIAQCGGNGDHAMQMQRQKIAAGRFAPPIESELRDFGIADVLPVAVELAQPCHVGNRFDIECENGRHECDVCSVGGLSTGSSLPREGYIVRIPE